MPLDALGVWNITERDIGKSGAYRGVNAENIP
jgi:hypothetical protein